MTQSSLEGSVTAQLPRLKTAEASVEAWFVDRYFERICSLARQHLGASSRAAHDEEDVALTVMRNFLEGAKQGTFQRLRNREDLHQILLMLTKRNSVDFFRRSTRRQKNEVGESEFGSPEVPFASVAAMEPDRDLISEISEEIRELFRGIEHETLKLEEIAIWRLQGFSVNEIAERLELLPHTIYRRLQLIRDRWSQRANEKDMS